MDFLLTEYICIVSIFRENLNLDVLTVFITVKSHAHDNDIVWVLG